MTFLEIEGLDYRAQINNDYDLGYDDCIKGYNAKHNASEQYNDGYGYAYAQGEIQSVGNN